MNLGFKDQFVPLVEDGSKTHTIRAGDRWRVGMRADLFARPRQRDMRLLFRAPVVRVEEIEIRVLAGPTAASILSRTRIWIGGAVLDGGEMDLFAWRDGFRVMQRTDPRQGFVNLAAMVDFWMATHKLGTKITVFSGQLIHWNYANRYDIGGVVSIEQVADAIRIYGFEPRMEAVEVLSPEQREAVELFCFKAHLRAGDIRCKVPPKPKDFDNLLFPEPADGRHVL